MDLWKIMACSYSDLYKYFLRFELLASNAIINEIRKNSRIYSLYFFSILQISSKSQAHVRKKFRSYQQIFKVIT